MPLQTAPEHMKLFARLRDEMISNAAPPEPSRREIPAAIYLDESRFALERARAFSTRPVIVGHESLIPRAGDHFAFDWLGLPLFAVRGADGAVRVFMNVCRHRGTRLVAGEDVARKPSFVCPYHQWTYDLEGALKNVPLRESFGDLDLSCRNLVRIPSATRHGFIWAQLEGEGPPDIDAFLGSIAEDFEIFGTSSSVVFRRSVTRKKANWKLIVEAFQDGYHVVRLHRQSIGPYFLDARAALERKGEHMRAAVARNEFREVIDAPPSAWNARTHVSFAHFVFPNSIFIIHPDYISHLGLYPQAVDETVVVHTCLIPSLPTTKKAEEHWERAYSIIEEGVFQREDLFVCEEAQVGMASGANETFLLSSYEYGIAIFHDILDEALAAPAVTPTGR